MSDRRTRWLAAICGIAGVSMLTAHFLIPGGVPPDSSGLPRIAAFARAHHDAVLISAWLQVTGAILYVGFILAVIHLAGASERFAGRIALLAAGLLVTLTCSTRHSSSQPSKPLQRGTPRPSESASTSSEAPATTPWDIASSSPPRSCYRSDS